MMTPPVVLMFVPRNAIVERDFARQATARQQLQRPVNGSDPDPRVALLNQPMQFVDRKVFASFQKGPQNGVALFGLLQTNPTEMPKKNPLRFANALTRDDRLIVDSFLQHVGWSTNTGARKRAAGRAKVSPT